MYNNFYVITSIFNPARYQSRPRLYKEFKQYIETFGVRLFTVELAYGDRPFDVTDAADPFNLQIRTNSELWHKERLLNLAIQRLPSDWKYVAWIDADVVFARPDWAKETVQLLQHYSVIQMFSHATDLDYKYQPLNTHRGIISCWMNGEFTNSSNYDRFHPGFAWAARRDALEALGGLFDVAILGAADRHMSMALISDVGRSHPKGLSKGYIEHLQMWQSRARKYIRANVGFIPGLLLHYWHGRKVDRRYRDRWQILVKHQYDPEFDVMNDTQGCLKFTDRNPQLKYDIREYFASRNEDALD